MTTEDLFTAAQKQQSTRVSGNVPELSVSELAFSLKKTLEDAYGRVRVRGELSGIKIAASGHMYGDIKDADAVVNVVCWRGSLSKLSIRPEDGLDVIVTGRVSSYPKSSRYQIIIDSMELAGEGALLKMLEERRKKLAAEGLFAPERKKDIPFLPNVIGVVTSPTGAVIRDILHRLSDRFPRHVLLWPVMVQGDGAADQIANAIRGFNAVDGHSGVPRPDLLIVARGGGSLEDLMAFNEENVVRAAAESTIPLISAVGHETDTTLIDYAADLRAPTPTGAAEMAVPMRVNLMAQILDDQERLVSAVSRHVSDLRNVLEAQAARLGDPKQLLEVKQQSLDFLSDKLTGSFERGLSHKESRLKEQAAMLRHPRTKIDDMKRMLDLHGQNLTRAGKHILQDPERKLEQACRLLETLSFERVLERGYVVVRDADQNLVTDAARIAEKDVIHLQFSGNQQVSAVTSEKKSP